MSSAPTRTANGFSMLKSNATPNNAASSVPKLSLGLGGVSTNVNHAAAVATNSVQHTHASSLTTLHASEPASAHARLSSYDDDNRSKKESTQSHHQPTHSHSLSTGHLQSSSTLNTNTNQSNSNVPTPRTGTPSAQQTLNTTSPSPSTTHTSPNISSSSTNATASALSNALVAAAASTSASLFNLKELFETVKMMSSGRVFTAYFANQSLMEPIKQDLFVFFDCSTTPTTTTTTTTTAASAAASKGKASTASASSDSKSSAAGGALYWSVVGRDGSLHRTRAADLSLSLSEIDDIYLGKRTTAFTLPFAANAREECCFSLIAKNRTHMNFEAKNPVSLVSWLFGLKRIVQANKKLLEAVTSPPQPFSLAAVANGGFLDIHDTNQTNLKQDIWQTFLQGIQAGQQALQLQTQQMKMAAAQSNAQQPQQQQQQQQQQSQQQQQNQQSQAQQPQSGGFLANLLSNKSSTKPSSNTASNQSTSTSTTSTATSASASAASNNAQSKAAFNTTSRPTTLVPPSMMNSGASDSSSIDPLQIFQILGRIGQGNYGYVYKARDLRCTNPQDALVAVKILEVDSAATSRELEAEINILAQCHSKYIVAYRGTFTRNTAGGHQQVWIVMEYCLAGSCCDLMAITDRILAEDQIGAVLKMGLQGLSYFHSLNHLHRDVKAGNLLINHEGIVKLSDFGVSAQLSASLSKRKTMQGSPFWMAPEVMTSSAHNQPYNEKADIWSIGATAIELATGDPPFHDMHPMKAIFAIPSLPAPRLPPTFADGTPCGWSADFEDFVSACMMKDPSFRPSAAQLLNHPFIQKAAGPNVIKQLVIECMPDIDKYREIEARMANKVAFGSRRGRAGEDSDSETSISRSRSSISRSQYEASYHERGGGGMRSAHSISDMRGMASQNNNNRSSFAHGNAAAAMNNPRAARWEKELSRSERDRDRRVREKEWEIELSRREVEYSQRSASPSFSTSSIGGAYWSSHDRLDRDKDGTRDRHGSATYNQQQPQRRFRAAGGSNAAMESSSNLAATDAAQHSPPSMRRSISLSANSAFVRARGTSAIQAPALTPSRSERDREGSFELDASGDQPQLDSYDGSDADARGLMSNGKGFDASPSFNTLYYRAAAARASGSDGFASDDVISPKASNVLSGMEKNITAGGLPSNLLVGVQQLSMAPSPTTMNQQQSDEGDRTRPSSATLAANAAAHVIAAAASSSTNNGAQTSVASSVSTPPLNNASRSRTPLASEKQNHHSGVGSMILPSSPSKQPVTSSNSSSASASSSSNSSPPPPPLPHLPSNSASPLTLAAADGSEGDVITDESEEDSIPTKQSESGSNNGLSKAQRKRKSRKEKLAAAQQANAN